MGCCRGSSEKLVTVNRDLLPAHDTKPINFVPQRVRQLMFALPQVIIGIWSSQKSEAFQTILNPLVVIHESRL